MLNLSVFLTKPYCIPAEHLEYSAHVSCDHSVIHLHLFKNLDIDHLKLTLDGKVRAGIFFFFISFCGPKKKEGPNNTKVSKWWLNLHFGVNYPFNDY